MRPSSYTIDIAVESVSPQFLLVHGYTGAIDIVPASVVEFLKTHKQFTKEDIPFSDKTIDVLYARGYITTKSEEEERKIVNLMSNIIYSRVKGQPPNFMFVVSDKCNFRCAYCFENNTFGDKNRILTKSTFDKAQIDKAYDAMLSIVPNREKHYKTITLYGGEPLLAENKDVVEYIVTKGVKLGYKFGAITNGYELDHFRNLLGPDYISRLQITLDGNKEFHNARRKHHKDSGTFDKIVENIGIALGCGSEISVRINTDRTNFDSLADLKTLFSELGYYKYDKFHAYSAILEDLGSTDLTKNLDIDYMNADEFVDRHKDKSYELHYQMADFRQAIYNAITTGGRVPIKTAGCSAQSGQYIFDPEGNIYSCWETIGVKNEAIGHYAQGEVVIDEENLLRWHNNVAKPSCKNCTYFLFCGGGCKAKTMRGKANINSYCKAYPHIFRDSFKDAYKQYLLTKTGDYD